MLAEAALTGADVDTATGVDEAATGSDEIDEVEIERFRRLLDKCSPEDFNPD